MLDKFSVVCDEPEGEVERTVWPMLFTPENLSKFYDKAKQYRTLFGREILTVQDFQNVFMRQDENGLYTLNGLFWVIDDFVGIFYLTDITDDDALAHYTFFDKRFKGRIPLVRTMLQKVFETYGFRRLSAEIPAYTPSITRHYAKLFGFVYEGRKRAVAPYKGDYYDVLLFGMLRDEAYKEVNDGKAES
jgi:RimJ/RimL family protein N-acetyltransferase